MEKYRARVHMLLLYPDNESHVEVLSKITKSYDYAGITHDRDTWTAEDEKKNPEHKQGELKKEHIHIVLRTPNATWNTAICKELGLEEKFCEQVKNIDRALQYLIHYNEPDKTQYQVDDVYGGLRTKLAESISKVEKSEGEKVVELIEYIEKHDTVISIKQFASYCAKNGYWAEFRRSASVFIKIIDEHNMSVRIDNLPKEKLSEDYYQLAIDKASFEGFIMGHQDIRIQKKAKKKK